MVNDAARQPPGGVSAIAYNDNQEGNIMPVGKELGKYKGKFNGVRTCSVVPGDTVVEGQIPMSGDSFSLSGVVSELT